MAQSQPAYIAIDASTERCSVALERGGQLFVRTSDSPRAHAQLLLGMVDELMLESGLSISELAEIAVSAGPGSFTGVRIAMSIAQGLAYGGQLPLVSVCSLDLMARALVKKDRNISEAESLVACLDARMGEVYWASYRWSGGKLSIVHTPAVSSPAVFNGAMQSLQNIKAAGHGLLLEAVNTQNFIAADAHFLPHAEQILDLRRDANYAADQHHDGYVIEPIYLRNEVAWEKRRRVRDTKLV